MADFDPPFASVGGVNRSPTTDEQSDGFSCGSADLTLFNRLIGRVEAELKAIQDEGGITGSEGDDTTVLQAIQAMISAATGGGDTSNYVLFTQAQARLPIFPEVTTNNGVIAVTSPSTGTVRVPASATVLHRGIRTITTSQTDLATSPSKTYHLRCAISAGTLTFSLKDLADTGSYNPTSATETNTAFDSTYDDMLVARVVTNSSNVATITNLVNKHRLQATNNVTASNFQDATLEQARGDIVSTINWARTPIQKSWSYILRSQQGVGQNDFDEAIYILGGFPGSPATEIPATRYAVSFTMVVDFALTFTLALALEA